MNDNSSKILALDAFCCVIYQIFYNPTMSESLRWYKLIWYPVAWSTTSHGPRYKSNVELC